MPQRYWTDARAKVEREGTCRVCGKRHGEVSGETPFRMVTLEFAHLLGRRYDATVASLAAEAEEAGRLEHMLGDGFQLYVDPLDGVPLCGPAADSRSCHHRYDARTLDVLPYLTLAEQAAAVRHVGIVRALSRLTGH